MEIRGSCKHYLPLHVPVIVFFNERFSFPESSADLLFFGLVDMFLLNKTNWLDYIDTNDCIEIPRREKLCQLLF